jgi:hypothetical protein
MAELDHRVKNILSVVSSVVSQTLKSGGPPEAMRLEVDGRITAIARAHSLLTRGGNAEGALLDLVRTELAPYDHIARITIDGDDVLLSSSAGITLALAIHELATNAAKYGALSVPEGQVDVSWRVSDGNPPVFTLVWQESDGPAVNPPTGRLGQLSEVRSFDLENGLTLPSELDFMDTQDPPQLLAAEYQDAVDLWTENRSFLSRTQVDDIIGVHYVTYEYLGDTVSTYDFDNDDFSDAGKWRRIVLKNIVDTNDDGVTENISNVTLAHGDHVLNEDDPDNYGVFEFIGVADWDPAVVVEL